MGWSYQGPVRLGLLLLLAVISLDARECKISCHGSSGNILRFEPGKVYSYTLQGQSVTSLGGASGEASRLGLTADVQVSALSNCEHALKVTNVQTYGTDNKKHNLDKLSKEPIKFGLQNGRIESELCATASEDNVGLNIKRAVLSLLQSSILKDSGYGSQSETDIFGVCPTGFEFSKSGGTITVVKNRDLNKCAYREDITLPFLSTPYYAKSDIQSSSLLLSTLRSEQKIEGGVLKSASLEEKYQYGPGAAEAEAKIVVRTQLKHVSTSPGAIPASCNEPRSIIFEREHTQESQSCTNKIVDLVRQGCDNRIVGQDTAQKFSQLVRTVAAASKSDIASALQLVKSGSGIKEKNAAQRMLLDAILLAQSASSVEIMADILKKREVTGNTARMWLLALGTAKHASRSSLLSVLPLLDGEPDINAYLGIGSLAGKYCREHSCEGVNEVNQLQIKLGAPLLKGCRVSSKKDEDHLIASLKGLGNIKYLGPKIAGKIIECVQDEHVSQRVRVAALETIATDPNKEQFKTVALNILKNINEDSEIRIKAYQALAKCPCGKVAGAIRDLLNTEHSNQVGGYIVSHLRNLHASTNPDKAAARHHLANIIPPRKFVIDPRRYSVNQEFSYAADIINAGASGEVDVIYSQNSYLPRSLSLNLTTQLFGTAYNLLEIDARAENIERIAEQLFGPKGYIKKTDFEDLVDDGRSKLSSILETIAVRYDKSLRPKRSISRSQLDNIANKVHLPSSDDIEVDLSLKVLGSEVAWAHVPRDSSKDSYTPEKIIDNYFGTLDSFIHALKNSDIDYRRHVTFIDREVTYPTGLGLALRLNHLGSAVIRLKLDGKIDLPAIIRDPKNADIRFQIVPSAAINLGGEITVDGVAFEAGVRVDLNIHSSTGSDVTLRVLNGRGVDVKLGLPIPKQEIISVKTEVHSVVRDDAQSTSLTPVKFDITSDTYSGCFDQLTSVLGLTFCGEVSVPSERKPVYPLFIPVNLVARIEKEDDSLNAYHFKAYYDSREDSHVHSLEVLLDTPNSKIPRRVSLNVEGSIRGPKKYLKFNAETPFIMPIALEANMISTNQEHSINAKLISDDQEYTVRIGTKATGSGNKIKYEPLLEYKAPEPTSNSRLIGKKGPKSKSQSFEAVGSVIVEKSPELERYVFQGLGISTPRTTYTLDGTVTLEPRGANGDLKVSYDKEHVTIKGRGKYLSNEVHGTLEVSPTQYPDLGISITLDNEHNKPHPGCFDQKLIIVHGPDPKSDVSRIYIRTKTERGPAKNNHLPIAVDYEIKYPVLQLDAGIKGKVTTNSFLGGVRGKLDKYSGKLETGVEINGKTKGDYQVSFAAGLMGNEVQLLSSRSVEGEDKSRFTNLLILKPGGTYQANALVTHRYVSPEEFEFDITADASIPHKAGIKLTGAAKRRGPQCESKIKLDVGDKCLIEGNTILNRGSSPNGKYKLSLPGYLDSEGSLNSDGSVSNAVASLHLPKADRKVEAKAEITTKAPKYSGVISINYDTKNPSKVLVIKTDNEVVFEKENYSIDTKNLVSLDDLAVKVNGKGKATGSLLHGTEDGELEVILPNGYHFGGKYSDRINFDGKNKEAETTLELYDQPKGEQIQKVKISGIAKHLDWEAGTIDGQASISYTSRSGKDANAHVNVKKLPSSGGKTSNINGEVNVDGVLVEHPIAFKIESEVSNEYFDFDDSLSIETDFPLITYKVSGSVGNEIKVEGNGKVNGPVISNQLSGKLPQSSQIRNFKIVSENLLDINADDSKEHSKVKFNNAVHWNDNRHVAVLVEGKLEDNGIEYLLQYETDSIAKRKVSGSAHYSQNEGKKFDASISVNADGKSSDLSVKGEVNSDKTESNLHILANDPHILNGEKIDIVAKQRIVKDGRGLHSDITVNSKDHKATAVANVEFDPDHPLLELNYDHPSGKSRFFFKGDKKGERHYASELKAKWTGGGGGSLSADHEFNLDSVDNFLIKAHIESTELEAKKIHVEVANKPTKGEAKKITFLVKTDDKVLASGTSNYNYKDEGDLNVLEGNGNLKYKDQSYPLTFQATRQRLDNGFLNKLNVKGGKMTLNVEHKITPEEFLIQRTFCKDQKTCSKAQISSKIKTGAESEEQNTVVLLDLSLFNPKLHDISFKSQYKRDRFLGDHNIELQWAQNSKIKSHAFIHEHSAGLYVTLPQRTIGGETKYDVKKRENSITYRLETDLYINKEKEPKLTIAAGSSTVLDKGVLTLAGEVKVVHPKLGKDLVARGQYSISDKPSKLLDGVLEIDVSPNPEYKVIGKLKVSGSKENIHTVATLKSKGCNIDLLYEEKIRLVLNGKDSSYSYSESFTYADSKNVKHELLGKFEASAKRIFALVKVPEIVLEGEYQLDKGYVGTHKIFGRSYGENLIINKDTNSIRYQLTGLEGGKTLTVEAGAKLGKNGVVRAALNEKSACNLNVALDESNFLKSQYSYDTEVLKSIYGALTAEANILFRDCSKSVQSFVDKHISEGKRFLNCLSKAKPNFSGVEKYAEEQLKQLKHELENDKTVKEAVLLLKEVSGSFGERFQTILEELVKFIKTLNRLGDETLHTLQESLKEIQPKIQASLQRLSKVFSDLLEQYLKLSVQLVNLGLDKVKEHEEDIKALTSGLVGFIQDFGKLIGETVITIDTQLEDIIKHNVDQLKDLPIVSAIQEKLHELKDVKVPDEVFNLLHEVVEQLKQLLPTSEATQFVSTASSVLERVLRQEEIKNKEEVLKQLYKEFIAAIKSLITLVAENAPQTGILKPVSIKSLPLYNFFRGTSPGGIRVSLVNLLTSKDFVPSLQEFLTGLKISLNPLDNVPPYKGHGVIIGGREVITFDGVHLAVPGSCTYVLSEDYKDRNFSFVGQISNGALKSITVSSRQDSIELQPEGKALVNGKQVALPAFAGELKVWQKPGGVGIWSESGLLILCSVSLDHCSVQVDGFYFGRLRGLLGNLNGEQYDERLTPEGKIVQTTGELANSWKLDGSCPSQSTAGHKHVRDKECTRLFTEEAISFLCRPFVDPAPYRDACDHLAASSKEIGPCLGIQGYVFECRQKGVLLADVPDSCASCTINGKTVKPGQVETVKQGSAADIVVVTELLKDNEQNYKQIANPLVADLKRELAKAGVNDVRVFLVGGGSPQNPYASYYTNLKGECAHDPGTNSLTFDERPVEHNETLVDRLKILHNFIVRESGHGHGNKMYKAALENPFVFRPNAYRLVIGVHGKSCPLPTPGLATHAILRLVDMETLGIQYSLITPFTDAVVGGKEVPISVLSEKESITVGGESLENVSYKGSDVCVHGAIESGGYVLSADTINSSPQRGQIIHTAASKIVSSLTSKQITFECECGLWHGAEPYPDCYV